ncbi:uncharacterized protein LOC135480722 [Liolophura sinensis]|uniref:uncharacterized protein LOC135480722 n=1 Tax=Liolophura sinensis TaxID=3198878 RepID=UPI0031593210
MGCTKKQACWLVLVILDVIFLIGSPITIIAIGWALGKPYHTTRHFSATNCTVQKVVKVGQIACHCDRWHGCTSHYPCVEIVVAYVTDSGKIVPNATLFDDAHNFVHYGYLPVTYDKEAIKCSTYSCDGSVIHDADNVATFVRAHGRLGQSYPCFYNQENQSEALLRKVSTTALALGLLFPLLCFIGALLLFIFLYHRILMRRGEKVLCLGRTYEIEPNELSPPVPVITLSESTF